MNFNLEPKQVWALVLSLGVLLAFFWAFVYWFFSTLGKTLWNRVKVLVKSPKGRSRIYRAENNGNLPVVYFLTGIVVTYVIILIILFLGKI